MEATEGGADSTVATSTSSLSPVSRSLARKDGFCVNLSILPRKTMSSHTCALAVKTIFGRIHRSAN